jgi:hypothetical protein
MRGTATPGEERLLAGYEPRGRGFESCQPRQKPFNNGLDACGAKPFFSARLLASHPSLNCSPRAEAWCGRTSPGPCWPPPPHARSWQWRSASPGSASRPWCLGAGGRKRGMACQLRFKLTKLAVLDGGGCGKAVADLLRPAFFVTLRRAEAAWRLARRRRDARVSVPGYAQPRRDTRRLVRRVAPSAVVSAA